MCDLIMQATHWYMLLPRATDKIGTNISTCVPQGNGILQATRCKPCQEGLQVRPEAYVCIICHGS